MNTIVYDNVKLRAKGQITLPRKFKEILGVDDGDTVTLIADETGNVYMANTTFYALKYMQDVMKGQAKKAGITSDDDVNALLAEVRATE